MKSGHMVLYQPKEVQKYVYYVEAMQTLRGLQKAGLVEFSEQEVLRVSRYDDAPTHEAITLNDEQQTAYDGLCTLLGHEGGSAALLHGVTASGKTQVYLKLIEEALRRGKRAMLLVPEIALTPQILRRFTAQFGDDVAMLHSALPLTERYDQWKRIRRGEVHVVLGTRSAVFAPLPDIGLIILDEEQETSYQSENPPRYHARDIAQFRCAPASGPLTLILMPSSAMVSHAGTAPLPPSISTEHRRQPPLASRSGWLQRWGMKISAAKAASSTDWPSFASISFPSIVIFIISLLFQAGFPWYQYSNPSSSAAAFSPAMRPLFRQKPMVLPARING